MRQEFMATSSTHGESMVAIGKDHAFGYFAQVFEPDGFELVVEKDFLGGWTGITSWLVEQGFVYDVVMSHIVGPLP